MSDDAAYSLQVHPGILSKECLVQSVHATKRTTASEVVNKVVSKLLLDPTLSYVLVELHNQKGEEMVLAQSDRPVQRMLLWPLQYQHTYKFLLRQTDEDGTVLYQGATTWQAKANKDSTQHHMTQKGFLPPTEPSAEDYPDLCALSDLTQDKILEVLKMRFLKDKIYTYTANMLISINPYKFLPIYNPKYMTIYQNRKKEELAPHIYAVADTAFAKMVESKQNQCVVITGKSGSGKTQATHFLVHHTLALCQKSYMTGVEHMLIGCGPVLEALGNAQTEHNNNSSRFGKFLRIYFYESGLLSGADIQTYLLEKSRLVHQEPNERNFHIFYYLLCGASNEELKDLFLDRNTSYEYINNINLVNEQEASSELDRLRQAMEVIGFFKGAQKNIFKLISAILLLGNITFRIKKGRDEALEIEDESYLHSVSTLLSLDPSLVRKCLLTRKAKAGAGERFVLDLKLNEAKATRDAMAKALYQSLFEWTVNSVNMALAQRTRDNKLRLQSRWIGLLDIFGFEDFVKNSFEQFCINYASEHLQHYCIKHTFQIEQEEYRLEGLSWKEVDYADNSGCLELYEKKPTGLFYLIDENFPGANNQILLSQFNRVHHSNPYFEAPVVKEDAFIIKHYAGKVKYRIKDFREKNHDQVREDIITLVRATKSSFIQEVISKTPAASFRWSILRAVVRAVFAFKSARRDLSSDRRKLSQHRIWRPDDVDSKHVQASYVHKKMMARLSQHKSLVPSDDYTPRYDGSSLYGKRKVTTTRSKKKINSISQQYQVSLASLLSALEKADPYFVRCIQPNSRKVPLKIDERLVLHQLRCSGTLQTITLEQSRYPFKYTPDQFLEQYKLLFSKSTRVTTLEGVREYLVSLKLTPRTHFQTGQTKVFLRNSAFHVLRDELYKSVLRRVICLQAYVRGWLARRNFLQRKAAAIKIQSFWRMIETQREIEEWHLAASIIQEAWHHYQNRKLYSYAVQIQAYCRGYLARNHVRKLRQLRQIEEQNACARIIQRTWNEYKRRREDASIVIQKTYRCYRAREAYRKLLENHREVLRLHATKTKPAQNEEIPFMDDLDLEDSCERVSKKTSDQIEIKQSVDPVVSKDQSSDVAKVNGVTNAGLAQNEHPLNDDSEEITLQYRKLDKTNGLDQASCHHESSSLNDLPQHKQLSLGHAGLLEDATASNHLSSLDTPDNKASASSKVPARSGSSLVKRIDQPPPSPSNSKTNLFFSKETSKVGDIFMKAAFSNKALKEYSKPKNGHNLPATGKTEQSSSNKLPSSPTKKISDSRDAFHYPTSDLKKETSLHTYSTISNLSRIDSDVTGRKSREFLQNYHNTPQNVTSGRNEDEKTNGNSGLKMNDVKTFTNNYKETTFSAEDMNVTETSLNKAEEIDRLRKEWLAFQKVEQERQFQELNKKVRSGQKRENKQERKIREEITALRLKQMSVMKEKMDSFGLGVESMPVISSLSRRTSEKTDPGIPSPPISPMTPLIHTNFIPENKQAAEPTKISVIRKSSSMESLNRVKSDARPRRQRSNSAIETYVDMRAPSSDPITRKANSLNAEAFARRCMQMEKLAQTANKSVSTEKLETYSQTDAKRGSAFIETMRKKFWGTNKGHNKQHNSLSARRSIDSMMTSQSSSSLNEKSLQEDTPIGEVKVRSTEAEQFSPKLLVSKPEELQLLDSFIKNKMTSFDGANLVDTVFKSALKEFCANLIALYSLALGSGSTNGLRYKDIVSNFRQVLEKNAKKYSLDQYAAMMAVNGFRGYMNEFMKDILPKHIVKESSRTKRKSKDDTVERMGHRFTSVQWGITQVCEFCEGTMWLMESGFMCKVCKFACHKKCLNKLTTPCVGASSSGKPKTKPRRLFGESLTSLAGSESLVPVFVDKCISYMEANGIYQEGIYRRSAASTQNKLLEEALNKDIECQKINFDEYNIHSVAACFKKFLRSLPSPLVPQENYFEFLQACKLTIDKERITSLFCVLEALPASNHATLERIVFHLARVAQQEPTNLMSPSNLAIVFTPCIFSPPPNVSPVDAAEHVGFLTKGVELIIIEQAKKVQSTLESLSEIQCAERTTSERLQKIRQSLGKGKTKKIRSSFREGPRSPSSRRPVLERHASLDAVEENSDLAIEEQKYAMKMANIQSRKASLTTRMATLTPQLSGEEKENMLDDNFNDPFSVNNEFLCHLNKHRVSQLPPRRRPAKYSSAIYSPHTPTPLPPPKEEGKPLRRITQSKSKGKLKRIPTLSSPKGEGDSFMRTSHLRSPIHRPHKKRSNNVLGSLQMSKEMKMSKLKGTMV